MPSTRTRSTQGSKDGPETSTSSESLDSSQSPQKRKGGATPSSSATKVKGPNRSGRASESSGDLRRPPVDAGSENEPGSSATPAASTGKKRGRPSRKEEELSEGDGGDAPVAEVETDADKQGTAGAADSSNEGMYSPRRSSRGVVPNRRFQDMDLEYWKKKPKEESEDEPLEKKPRVTKKGRPSKEPKTPTVGLDVSAKQTTIEIASPIINVRVNPPPSSAPAASALVFRQSPPSAAPRHPPASSKSPRILVSSSSSFSSPSSLQQALTSSVGSLQHVAQSRVPASGRNIVSLSSTLPVSSSRNAAATTSTSLSVSIPRPVSNTASASSLVCMNCQKPSSACSCKQPAVSAVGRVTKSILTRISTGERSPSTLPTSESVTLSGESSAMEESMGQSTDESLDRSIEMLSDQTAGEEDSSQELVHQPQVLDLASDGAASQSCSQSSEENQRSVAEGLSLVGEDGVEVALEQDADGNPVVTIVSGADSALADQGKQTDGHGRVVSKDCEILSSSRSVYVVRSSTSGGVSQIESVTTTSGRSLVATPSITRESDVGDVMSLVELAPNKKVPVILAERKEHNLAGKMVKVVSSQQVRPDRLQELVTSHMSQLTSKRAKEKHSQKPMTVEVSMSVLQSRKSRAVATSAKSTANSETKGTPPPSEKSSGVSLLEERESAEARECETATSTPSSPTKLPHPTESAAVTSSAAASATSSSVALAAMITTATQGSQAGDQTDCLPGESTVQNVGLSLVMPEEERESEEDYDEEDEEEADGRYASSGTQTPYNRDKAKKVVIVRVHPPEHKGEQNKEVVTVTKVKDETPDDDLDLARMDRDEALRQEWQDAKKCKYVIVELPEGATVTQPVVRAPANRIDQDPNFYTVDEHGMYTCDVCDYSTSRRPNIYKHKKKHVDSNVRPFACDICDYRAATSSNLKRHQEIHKDIRNHNCHICGLNFRQKIHLERHIKYRHEEKKVKCPLCDYVCANENPDLKVHIKRRHILTGSEAAVNAFKCQQCGIVANSKRDLKQHLKFHVKGPELKLFCHMCSFVTDCESRLRRHQYIHTKEKPFQCGLCDYKGSQKEHVLRHMRTQHNIEISRRPRSNKRFGSDSGDLCEGDAEGGKVTERADYTSDEKIFACNHCTMKFAKLINLYKHLHTQHRDIMPNEEEDFSCVVCDFHTSNKKNLLVHMRRHNINDQSPPTHVYSCVLCRYMNPKRRNLFQHMRKKHHIEIVMRDDGTTTCFVGADGGNSAATVTSAGGTVVSSPNSGDGVINILPVQLSDLISTVSHITTVAQSVDLHSTSIDSSSNNSGNQSIMTALGNSPLPASLKIEDLAMVVTNPQTTPRHSLSSASLVAGGMDRVETITIGPLSGDDAAQAVQGLQALAQRGVLDSGGSIVEEHVQVMGSDDQTTFIIDPSGSNMGIMEQLVPKSEPMEIIEIDGGQLVPHHSNSSTDEILEGGAVVEAPAALSSMVGEGLPLSTEQLMNLATGDYLEINGEMYKVEVSSATNADGSQGPQVISFEPATSPPPQSMAMSGNDLQEQQELEGHFVTAEVSQEAEEELS